MTVHVDMDQAATPADFEDALSEVLLELEGVNLILAQQ